MRRHFKTLRGPNASQLHRPDPPPRTPISAAFTESGGSGLCFPGVLRGPEGFGRPPAIFRWLRLNQCPLESPRGRNQASNDQ